MAPMIGARMFRWNGAKFKRNLIQYKVERIDTDALHKLFYEHLTKTGGPHIFAPFPRIGKGAFAGGKGDHWMALTMAAASAVLTTLSPLVSARRNLTMDTALKEAYLPLYMS